MDEQCMLIRGTVSRFVSKELMPLENEFLNRTANGIEPALSHEHQKRLGALSKELGLWGLDAPENIGGMNLPQSVMICVTEELAKTCVPFQFPPDSPNLHMLSAVGSDAQKAKYLPGYIDGTLKSAIAISEPGAGSDPAGMQTHAIRDAEGWRLNGRKIWISNAKDADFIIVMARVGDAERHGAITSFIVEKETPGFTIDRPINMIGGYKTYEIGFDNCRLPEDALLGEIGKGYKPMQLRLLIRRLEMGASAIGMTQRVLAMLVNYAKQRVTFNVPLADRQAIQWWIADVATRVHACRLMLTDAASRLDRGEDIRLEASMIKVYATELAYDAIDHAMQTLGALGMTQETALYPMWQLARLMRIYEGPSEVHRQSIAKRVLGSLQ